MKVLISASIVLLAIVSGALALKCYECSGSEMSDCAKGLKSAGVVVDCNAPDYEPPVPYDAPTESSTEVDATTTESNYEKMKRLGCFQPLQLYPACVTYSMKPYNGVEGQQIIYRSCMLTADDFCKSHLQYNKESMCKSCNSTDFCM